MEKELFNRVDGEKTIEHFWEIIDSNETILSDNFNLYREKSLTFEYQVVATQENDNITFGEIVINSNESEFNEQSVSTIKNTINNAELTMSFTPKVSEECEWYSNTVQTGNLKVTNISQNELKDVNIQITLIGELNCEYDGTYLEPLDGLIVENIKKEYNKEINQTIITFTIKSIEAGKTVEVFIKPYITIESVAYNQLGSLEFYATATTNTNKTYSSNTIIRSARQITRKVEVNQSATINGTPANENSVANDGDIIEFITTIKNGENNAIEYNVTD